MEDLESLITQAHAAQDAADFKVLERVARAMIAQLEGGNDQRRLAEAYRYLGTARHYASDGRGASAAYTHALEISEAAADPVGSALATMSLGNMALEQYSDIVEGRRLHELSEPAIRAAGDKRRLAILTGNLGEICRAEGNYDRALEYARESLALFLAIDDTMRASWQRLQIALIAALRREYTDAIEGLAEAQSLLDLGPNAYWQAMAFDIWFLIATSVKAWEPAAKLMGFTEKFRDEQRVPRLLGLMSAWYPPCVERLTRQLRAETLLELRLHGAALTLTQAQALTATLSLAVSP